MKKTTKQFWAMLIAGTMALGCFTGCGNKEVEETNKSSEVSKESEVVSTSESTEVVEEGPITTEPITITLSTTRQSTATNSADDIWLFKYLEWYMNEKGYNLTIEVTQSPEITEQMGISLSTNTTPDVVWGWALSLDNALLYGEQEGTVLDWAPYINEEHMPNLYAALQKYPQALEASTLPGGGVYGLPYLATLQHYAPTDATGVYINKTWLEECNLEVPRTVEEFLNVLRAFNGKIEKDGINGVALMDPWKGAMFDKWVKACFGFYGSTSMFKYGHGFLYNEGEIEYVGTTDEYRTYMELLNTMYTEGLIAEDYLTVDRTAVRGKIAAGECGVFCDSSISTVTNFQDYIPLPPFKMGESEPVYNLPADYNTNKIWARADFEYPEVLAEMLDWLYSKEGIVYSNYGPLEGEDPLNMVDGWYIDENNNITTELVVNGKEASMGIYGTDYIYSTVNTCSKINLDLYAQELAGAKVTVAEKEVTDSISGEKILYNDADGMYSMDNAAGYGYLTRMETYKDYITSEILPTFSMSEEDAATAGDLTSVLNDYHTNTTAKFITGERSLDEFDEYVKEMNELGLNEYIDLYMKYYK